MRWIPILLLAGVIAACGSPQRQAADTPPPQADNPPAKTDDTPVKPDDTPADENAPPSLIKLDGTDAPWSKVFVSGKRNVIVFMTVW